MSKGIDEWQDVLESIADLDRKLAVSQKELDDVQAELKELGIDPHDLEEEIARQERKLTKLEKVLETQTRKLTDELEALE